jgi:WD40 repeat protein
MTISRSVALSLFVASLWTTTAVAQVHSTFLNKANPNQSYAAVFITPDDQYVIATHEQGISIWNSADAEDVFTYQERIEHPLYDPVGSRLLFCVDYGEKLVQLTLKGPPDEWKVQSKFENFKQNEPLAVSPDGKYLALKMEQGSIAVVLLENGKRVFQTKLENSEAIAFAPDSKRFAVSRATDRDAVICFSLPEGERLASSAAFLSGAGRMAYRPGGDQLAVACTVGGNRGIALLDAERLRPLPGFNIPIYSYANTAAMAWSREGNLLLVGQVGKTSNSLGIFDVETKLQTALLKGFQVGALAANADATRIASVSTSVPGTLWWDWQAQLRFRSAEKVVATHPKLDYYQDNSAVPLRLSYSPDGKQLALAIPEPYRVGVRKPLLATDEKEAQPTIDLSLLDENTAYIFLLDAGTGQPVKGIHSKSEELKRGGEYLEGNVFDNLKFLPGGTRLATLLKSSAGSPGHLIIWNVETQTPRIDTLIEKKGDDSWQDGWIDLAILEAGEKFLMLPYAHRKLGVQILDRNTSTVQRSITGEYASSLALLPNDRFASGFATWNYHTGEALFRENSGYATYGSPIAHAADNLIAGVYSDDELGLWNLDTLELSFPFTVHRPSEAVGIHQVATFPQRELLATACFDQLIRIWHVPTARLLVTLRGHRRAVDAICFSPDGKTLASASRDGTTRFWDVSDLGQESSAKLAAELPTRRTFETTGGAKVTVVFDRPATPAEIRSALEQAQEQLAQ